MNAFVYHEDYNKYDLAPGHPLIGDKPRRTLRFLKEKNLLDDYFDVFTPMKAGIKDLLRVHAESYVDHIIELSRKGGFLSSDTPAPKGIYEIASLAAGGSILGGCKLFEGYECSVNPLGGFHHASRDHSSGFCFFNDIAITIEYLREKHNVKRFAVIDLDVHHGNGTQDIYASDPTVLNISFHQDGRTLYPGTGSLDMIGEGEGKGYTVNLPLPPGTVSADYMHAFDEIIPPLILQFKPEIIIYQSGVDTHHSDPLAGLKLIYQTYYHLARRIKNLSDETCRRLLVLLGGGYSTEASVICYYNIICGLLDLDVFIKEEEILSDYEYEIYKNPYGSEIETLIQGLKGLLKPYWKL
jgi:acetoin utilization protein AcuC